MCRGMNSAVRMSLCSNAAREIGSSISPMSGVLGEALAFHQSTALVVRARNVALAQPLRERIRQPVHRDGAELIAVIKLQAAIGHVAKTVRLFQYRLEHRCEVTRRRINDLQYLGRRRLLLQRLAEVIRALAQFPEQARVLDGNHGLRREVRHQLDLLGRECQRPLAVDQNSAKQVVILEHGNADYGPRTSAHRQHGCVVSFRSIEKSRLGLCVDDMHRLSRANQTADHGVRTRPYRPVVDLVLELGPDAMIAMARYLSPSRR